MARVIELDDPNDHRLDDYRELNNAVARRWIEGDESFITEGPVAVAKLLTSGHRIRSVLTVERQRDRVLGIVGNHDATVIVVSRAVLEATVGFDLHRGIVAAADRRRALPLDRLLTGLASSDAATVQIAVLEGLNDPENLGLIARSARAFGIDALILDPACIDPYYRRTVRVSMGEVLLLPVTRAVDWPGDLGLLHDAGFETWAMTPGGEVDLATVAPSRPARLAVVFGAEGPGIAASTIGYTTRRVSIPIDPAVDSINVGHAAAITFAAIS